MKNKGIDKISSIIEANHDPANLSFIALCKVTNCINENVSFLTDFL